MTKIKVFKLACLVSCLLFSTQLLAGNGPQLIGFSAESTALAGSGHVAIADTSAMNTNPAALSLIQGTRLDLTAGWVQAFFSHSDTFGNDSVSGQNDLYALANQGFATRIDSIPGLTIGAGIFAQGGYGSENRNFRTAFGTRDGTASFFRYLKFSIALSYELTEKLSVGVAPSIGYADISLSLFPGTSVAPSSALPNGFAGLEMANQCSKYAGLGSPNKCASDVVFGAKVGFMYKMTPSWTVGASYTSPVNINFSDGQTSLNFTELGLGNVNYDNTRLTGLKWPQQVDLSTAKRFKERFLVAFTMSWINWDSINNVKIITSSPDNALAPAQTSSNMPFNWKDQVALSLGLSYTAIKNESWKDKDRLVLRFGYNYSSNPIPNETLGPLAPLILEHHFTGGFGYRFTENWSYDLGGLYGMNNSKRYTNDALPFGPNAKESINFYLIYNTLSYRF